MTKACDYGVKMPNLDMRTGKEKVLDRPRYMDGVGAAEWKHRPMYAKRPGTYITNKSHDVIVSCVNYVNSIRVSKSEEKNSQDHVSRLQVSVPACY